MQAMSWTFSWPVLVLFVLRCNQYICWMGAFRHETIRLSRRAVLGESKPKHLICAQELANWSASAYSQLPF